MVLSALPSHGRSTKGVGNTPLSVSEVAYVIDAVSWDCAGRQRHFDGSDLWPWTWSDDDKQYTGWGDGTGPDGSTRVTGGIASVEDAAGSGWRSAVPAPTAARRRTRST